ncbi:MAG: hypothetical protein QGF94_05600, partial [Candidatus Thalassarchaeaceae archaeon]|nr:hypothetical protein [Candidatus Thalassarchaeaceae archaeon]
LERMSSLKDERFPSADADMIPIAGATMKFPLNPSSVGPREDEEYKVVELSLTVPPTDTTFRAFAGS